MNRPVQLLSVGAAIRTLGSALYNPFLALFLYSVMQISYLEIGLIFVLVGGIQLPFGLVGGLWADRIGRRRLIVLSLVTEAVFVALLAYAFDIRSLILAIVVATIAGCLLSATGAAFSAYIADWAAASDRTRAFTWYRVSFNVGFAVGTALGGTLVEFIGFVDALLVASGIIAVAAGFVVATLSPSPVDLQLRAGRVPVTDPTATASPARSLRQSLSILSRDRVALLVALAFALAYVSVGQWNVTFSLFVHNKLGISYFLLGVGLAINGVIVVVGQSFTTESLIGRRHTTIAILGTVLYVVAYLVLGVSALFVLFPVLLFFLAVIVLTVGENVVSIPQSTLPSNLAPAGEVGSYNGAFNTFVSAAGLAAIFFGGAVLTAVSNPLLEWVILVLPAFPAIVLMRWASRRIANSVDRA